MKTVRPSVALLLLMFLQGFVPFAHGQAGGSIRGTVTLAGDGSPIHGVPVRILELGLSVLTAADGSYAFAEVPPGTYQIMASLDGFNDMINTVTVAPGSAAISDFQLRLIGHRDEITVTASGREEVAYQSFKVTASLDSVDLAKNARASIGEALEQQPGIAKRSYGPGPSRPVIRGFDGDRVLILQDGARTGSLSSQSGDHAEPINALSLDRLEVVKGPSTLLYGSNALGGVVNAITGHDHAHPGLRGALTAVGGSNNGQGSANGSFEFGAGRLLIWGSGGGQRTGNYRTARGEIFNSETRLADASVGAGWFGERGYFSAGYDFGDARYGIPTGTEPESQIPEDEELVDLSMRRHSVPLRFGWTNLGSAWDALRVALTYNQYHHKELNREEVETTFDNKQFTYRATLEQPQGGRYSGTFGLEGWHRDYQTVGAEALTPPVVANAVALFGMEEFNAGRLRFQLGGRYEHTRYNPDRLRARSFHGVSGSAGAQFSLWEGGSLLVNYTHSARTPALEELYNYGPHPGNQTFEIGNTELGIERGDGIDLSLRQSSSRLHGEANFYYYRMGDFVYLAPTGEQEDGLPVANYSQADSRFLGGELNLELGLHPDFWVNLGLDAVSAELTNSGTPLPRIPPLRGRVGFEAQYKGLRFQPELVLADAQDNVFPLETRTAGYAVVNLEASYTLARQHAIHIFSVNAFNLGDRYYRNHLSFIKELAPEIGRGVSFTYTMRFF